MTTVAFIGLGIMGAPMARNLLKAGYDVIGYNRGRTKVAEFEADGGRGAASIAEAVSGADVVTTMVPDSADVTAALTGANGALAYARAGTLVIDFSSIRPDVARKLAAAAAAGGLRMLDAPVSGGEPAAIDGTLSIMIGGEADDVASALPLFEQLGTTVVHVGPSGAGQTVKAANQLIVGGAIQLLAEALVLLEAHGVDLDAALRVLGGGLAGSTVVTRKGPAMIARKFDPGFRLALHHKDMGIVTAAARDAGVAIPVGGLVAQLVAAAVAQGDGPLDHSALLRGVERLAGRGGASSDDHERRLSHESA